MQGKRIVLTPDIREDLNKIYCKTGWSVDHIAKEAKLTSQTVYNILRGRIKSMLLGTWTKLVGFLQRYYPKKLYKPQYEQIAENGSNSGMSVSQRPGIAHLCVSGRLLCGETDIENVRYYRAHEEWLNQCEICPQCLKAWNRAEALWSKQEKS